MVLKLLDEYNFHIKNLFLFASEKSKGKTIYFKGIDYLVEILTEDSFNNMDFVFFCGGTKVSKEWAMIAEASGAYVIDNSSYFRMDEDICLIVPNVNFNSYNYKRKIISNPNCSTIQSVVVLNALKKFNIKRIIYTTYQAVSGSGMKGINDLKNTINGEKENYYPYNISKTCIPQIDVFLDNGYTKEEVKMIEETKKILNLNDVDITATCVRVPVENSHAVSMVVEFEGECSIEEILFSLRKQENLIVLDDYPTSIHSNGNDNIYVGRIRKDLSKNNSYLFYCVADNIRVGAASNAVKIALEIIKKSCSKSIA